MASDNECSLGNDVLDKMSSRTPNWPNPSPENYKECALAWCNCLDAGGDTESMDLAFLTLLAYPKVILRHKISKRNSGIILRVSKHGAVVWKQFELKKSGSIVELDVHTGICKIEYFAVRDISEWEVCELRFVPPAAGASSARLVFEFRPGKVPLLVASARRGFPSLNASGRKALFTHLKVPYTRGQKPTRDQAIFEALLRFALPDHSDEQINTLIDTTSKPALDIMATDMPMDFDVDDPSDLIESHHQDEWIADYKLMMDQVQDKLKQYRDAKDAKRPKAPALVPGKAASSAADPDAVPERRKNLVKLPVLGFTQAQGKWYCPAEWILTKSESRYPYWQCRHSKLKAVSYSKGFTATGETDNSAFLHCVRSAWQFEYDVNGLEMPYVFVGSVDVPCL